nr:hypothetical protein [Tanacetum cinerariifolium]
QAANARYWKIPACYDDDDDDDDDDYAFAITPNEPVNSLNMRDEHLDTIPATKLNEFIKSGVENHVPILITPNEPVNSLSMGDEHLDTIPATKSDEVIKSSVEDLVPNPKSMLNHDSSIISFSLKIYSLLDEFAGELILLKSIPPGVDKTDCHPKNEIRLSQRLLYDNSSPRPPEEFNSEYSNAEIESFSPSPIPNKDSDSIMKEIDLFLTPDDPMPPRIEDDEDSEGDILFQERLLHDDPIPLPDTLDFSYEVRTFLPFLTYPVTSPVLLSPNNHDYYNEQNSCFDSNSFGFNQSQPQKYTVNHPIFNAHNDYLDSQIQLNSTLAKITKQMTSITSLCEMACEFVQKKLEEKQLEEERAAKAQN